MIGTVWLNGGGSHSFSISPESSVSRPSFRFLILTGLGLALSVADAATSFAQAIDQTQIEQLGNPFFPGNDNRRYARNVWDMQVFGDRLYFGHGNSSNLAPAPNAGPIPVISYRESAGFNTETVLDEEQIERFRVTGDQLTVPGHDPVLGAGQGTWSRLESGGWVTRNNIPNNATAHTYDMIEHNGNIYAALGSRRPVAVSTDNGQSFQSAIGDVGDQRLYDFLNVNGDLYAVGGLNTTINGVRRNRGFAKLESDGQFSISTRVTESVAFPGYNNSRAFDTETAPRSAQLGNQTVYVGALAVNDHQWDPFGLYAATGDFDQVDDLLGGISRGKPFDLLSVSDSELWVLTGQEQADGWTIEVLSTTDLNQFDPIVSFTSPTFARSFELFNDDLYFGLGSFTDDIDPATGNVLRIRSESFISAVPEPGTTGLMVAAMVGGMYRRRRKAG